MIWSLVAPMQADAQTFTVLYTFDSVNYANGSGPIGPLAMDGNGVLYGVTAQGGAYSNCFEGEGVGCGTVYSLAPPTSPGGGWTEEVLWSFGASAADGSAPNEVIMGPNGVLYGTTTWGGQSEGGGCCGAVFSLTPPSTPEGAWTEAVIWAAPVGGGAVYPDGLVIGGKGELYGTDLNGRAPRRRLLAKPSSLARRGVDAQGTLEPPGRR